MSTSFVFVPVFRSRWFDSSVLMLNSLFLSFACWAKSVMHIISQLGLYESGREDLKIRHELHILAIVKNLNLKMSKNRVETLELICFVQLYWKTKKKKAPEHRKEDSTSALLICMWCSVGWRHLITAYGFMDCFMRSCFLAFHGLL